MSGPTESTPLACVVRGKTASLRLNGGNYAPYRNFRLGLQSRVLMLRVSIIHLQRMLLPICKMFLILGPPKIPRFNRGGTCSRSSPRRGKAALDGNNYGRLAARPSGGNASCDRRSPCACFVASGREPRRRVMAPTLGGIGTAMRHIETSGWGCNHGC